jgi:hypothetical protein
MWLWTAKKTAPVSEQVLSKEVYPSLENKAVSCFSNWCLSLFKKKKFLDSSIMDGLSDIMDY